MEAAEPAPGPQNPAVILALISGLVFPLFLAFGFVVAVRGIRAGLAPSDIVFHRLFWPGLVFAVMALRNGFADFRGLSLGRASLLTIIGGPGMLIISYTGFIYSVLGHGAVIQPAVSTLWGLLLASMLLAERMTTLRWGGALAIVIGLVLLGAEAALSIGREGVLGDLCFVVAGTMWSTFGTLIRLWQVDSRRALVIVSVLALPFYAPLHAVLFGFERMIAVGLWENLAQIVAQGILAGPTSIFLYAYTAGVLGAGRAVTFASMVPVFALLIGIVMIGDIPTLAQILGLVTVLIGARLVIAR